METWKSGFEFYMWATESDQKSDKIKASILLTCIGECGREIYETFDFANAALTNSNWNRFFKSLKVIVIEEALPL